LIRGLSTGTMIVMGLGHSAWQRLATVAVAGVLAAGCGDDTRITGGTIAHWNGVTWTLSAQTGGANNRYLSGVWGSRSDDVWAVGLGMIQHWDGAAWSTVVRREDETAFRSVWGSGASDVWVGGSELLHWDGVAWSSVGLPPGSEGLFNGFSLGPDNAWAVSRSPADGYRPATALYHWNGTTWSAVWRPDVESRSEPQVAGIWASSSDDVWVVGFEGDRESSLVLRWDGSTWAETLLGGDGLRDLWGSGRDDVWVVGGEDGVGMHWDGRSWSPQRSGYDVWGTDANNVWMVGESASSDYWNGTTWSSLKAPAPWVGSAVWASSPHDVWVVGGVAD
jgi:hypothetical protein